jgi:hypothetical protein
VSLLAASLLRGLTQLVHPAGVKRPSAPINRFYKLTVSFNTAINLKKYIKKSAQLLGTDSISSFMRDYNKINGGGRGIRTPARYDPPVGFQDRSLQPDLGIPPC